MRRGNFNKKYLILILITGIFQLFSIISDQVVLQIDASIKKDESKLKFLELQTENSLNNNLYTSDIQRLIIDVLYNIDEYNEVINEDEKYHIVSRVHKTGSYLYDILTEDYILGDIIDKKIINDSSDLISFQINEENFDDYYNEVYNSFADLNDSIQHYADLIWQGLDEINRLVNKISDYNKYRHRLILLGVISQIISLFILLVFFRLVINDRLK